MNEDDAAHIDDQPRMTNQFDYDGTVHHYLEYYDQWKLSNGYDRYIKQSKSSTKRNRSISLQVRNNLKHSMITEIVPLRLSIPKMINHSFIAIVDFNLNPSTSPSVSTRKSGIVRNQSFWIRRQFNVESVSSGSIVYFWISQHGVD